MTEEYNKPKLTIIKGGLSADISDLTKQFVSAQITDTRLMGVLAIHARWYIEDLPDSGSLSSDFHQFFYIDCEETGFETYSSCFGGLSNDVEAIEQAVIGGLGANKIDVSEYALRGILIKYRDFNARHGLPLPDNYDEYSFLFDKEIHLSLSEEHILMDEVCGNITSEYQVVNYFLMRCFGRDYEGARYLTRSWHNMEYEAGSPEDQDPGASRGKPLQDDFPLDIYDSYINATFYKNVIDIDRKYADGSVSFICESLIETGGDYRTVISKVVVNNLQVVGFEHCSGFHVSNAEAAMMLARPEFISVYEIILSQEDIDNNIGELTLGLDTVMSTHNNGRMLMAFKSTNDHVNSRVFMLNNDIHGLYFVTNYGQLIVAAYSLPEIHRLESLLFTSMLSPYLIPGSKYEFKEPVLYEFTESDFADFDEFVEFLKG